jgi:hypothetical protein
MDVHTQENVNGKGERRRLQLENQSNYNEPILK